MSRKSGSLSASDSSPEENNLYLTASFIRDRDDKGWKTYLSNAELMTSAIFSHMNNSDDTANNQVSFLYDYYGMTEETRQDPPSPGQSSSNEDKEIPCSSEIDIPIKEKEEPSILGMRHSFPESGKLSYPFFNSHSTETSPLTKRSSSSISSLNRISCQTCTSTTIASPTTSPTIQQEESSYERPSVLTDEKYVFILEAQTSVVQKRGEDSLTYINKGQFYYLSFESKSSKISKVKSIIYLVFGHEKDIGTELAHWRYWYNQQPNPNQRAFDIDIKACQDVDEEIEEVGYNALSFTWSPSNRAKISLRINCLSTDFSAQKGVKGIPLHIQVDTYEDLHKSAVPVHRAFCRIKVFRDKGAERKNKDESKLVGKRMVKFMKGAESTQQDMTQLFQMANKVTVFYSTSPLSPTPVVFIPSKERTKSFDGNSSPTSPPPSDSLFSQLKEREKKRGFNVALTNAKDDLEQLDVYPKFKSPRVVRRKEPAVTVYVRKEEEKAYNALMLDNLTLEELKQAVGVKYGVPVEMIKNVYKKTKKGILVYMDDQLIERFVDEDDYMININFDNQLGHFEVIFS